MIRTLVAALLTVSLCWPALTQADGGQPGGTIAVEKAALPHDDLLRQEALQE